ncbi:hypothetical protein KC131_11265 [Pseudomonas sp. JQ170]|uniref:hypothetical protein n=1 Tax=unclassified Pseudomonas TaxID=196821 RepID=UPI000F9CE113|nr:MULTISPECIES: hypothetical protein [unclassified Pseudomonas]MDN7141220.1 hypothetical protein [Pseudomonas sp. JQ170]WRO78198.1 hypothetical protein U9R80_11175 [Pseudomonas sp. 170C]
MIKKRTFKQAASVVIGFWLIAEVVTGFIRNPIDDRFTGSVAIINGGKANPIDATMTLDMLEGGFVINKRPQVENNTGVRLAFDGKDVQVLKSLGLQDNFVVSEDHWRFKDGFCELKGVRTTSNSVGLNPENLHMQRGMLTFTSAGKGCMAFNVAITDFDHIEFTTYKRGILPSGVIYASLERDSRLSFIQRTIMRMRFESWVSDNPIFGKLAPRT